VKGDLNYTRKSNSELLCHLLQMILL